MLLGKNDGVLGLGESSRPTIVNHQELESYLGRYCGLMLYLKEMDESRYSKVCAVSPFLVTMINLFLRLVLVDVLLRCQ